MDYKATNDKLNEATALLDQVANEFAKAEIIQKKAWVKLIGKSMERIFVLQPGIYSEQPELRQPFLAKEPVDKATNQQLGDILVGIQGILAKNKPIEAIKIVEEFLKKNPPEYLVEIAKGEIAKIKQNFSVYPFSSPSSDQKAALSGKQYDRQCTSRLREKSQLCPCTLSSKGKMTKTDFHRRFVAS